MIQKSRMAYEVTKTSMEFKDVLNDFIGTLHCSAKDLAEKSGLSAATISRFRSGDRNPAQNREQLESLAGAIAQIAAENKIEGIRKEAVSAAFEEVCASVDFERLRMNFNTLISVLSINISELAKVLNYDPSYLSRIRNGQRRPSDPQEFAASVARFVVRRYDRTSDAATIRKLIGSKVSEPSDEGKCFDALAAWLTNGVGDVKDYMSDFLYKLNEFDLNEYIKAIHFDELKVPSVPFQFPTSKHYSGLQEMMNSELDFLKATVLSKSNEPVIMYSDMPLEDMAKDAEFPKKWMFGMAMMLKKGLHLYQIHYIDRSFEDMMLGLESWIPMYMTGQVFPYYIPGSQNGIFSHLLKVSGTTALSGESITGFHGEGRYELTKAKDEVAYYKKRANELLSKALPLMEIYKKESENAFHAFLQADMNVPGNRRAVLSSLPLYTLSDALLNRILRRNQISDVDGKKISEYASQQRVMAESLLSHSSVSEELPEISEEDFAKYPMTLSLSGLFYETDILYSYDDYREHLILTQHYEAEHGNYHMKLVRSYSFRNIQMIIHEGKWSMVSKNKAPSIHFVIRHPKMRNAIENFIVSVKEK